MINIKNDISKVTSILKKRSLVNYANEALLHDAFPMMPNHPTPEWPLDDPAAETELLKHYFGNLAKIIQDDSIPVVVPKTSSPTIYGHSMITPPPKVKKRFSIGDIPGDIGDGAKSLVNDATSVVGAGKSIVTSVGAVVKSDVESVASQPVSP